MIVVREQLEFKINYTKDKAKHEMSVTYVSEE